MTTWTVFTDNGERQWEADDAAHAIEQHEDAHAGQEGECVWAVIESSRHARGMSIAEMGYAPATTFDEIELPEWLNDPGYGKTPKGTDSDDDGTRHRESRR